MLARQARQIGMRLNQVFNDMEVDGLRFRPGGADAAA